MNYRRCERCFAPYWPTDENPLCSVCRGDVHTTMSQLDNPPPSLTKLTTDDELNQLRSKLGVVYPQTLADALGMSIHTLQLWRQNGEGPKFVKLGRNVFYRVSDIDTWLKNNIADRVRERVNEKDTPSMYREQES